MRTPSLSEPSGRARAPEPGEMWGDLGRGGEIWGDVGEIWGDLGEIWGSNRRTSGSLALSAPPPGGGKAVLCGVFRAHGGFRACSGIRPNAAEYVPSLERRWDVQRQERVFRVRLLPLLRAGAGWRRDAALGGGRVALGVAVVEAARELAPARAVGLGRVRACVLNPPTSVAGGRHMNPTFLRPVRGWPGSKHVCSVVRAPREGAASGLGIQLERSGVRVCSSAGSRAPVERWGWSNKNAMRLLLLVRAPRWAWRPGRGGGDLREGGGDRRSG